MADTQNVSAPTAEPKTIKLSDYTPPPYRATHIDLAFDLHPQATRVTAVTKYEANHDRSQGVKALPLDGEKMSLIFIQLDDKDLIEGRDYTRDDHGLTILLPPAKFTLRVVTEVNPEENKALEGLYLSRGKFTTQCEAEGFRRITYFQDRPDVMTRFRVTLTAPKSTCPVLLSNGNPVEFRDEAKDRHSAVWDDPYPKPCYLFALVAGDLGHIADTFTTRSGRKVDLKIYVERGKEPRALYAMDSLKRAMTWDEEKYGREYDLDVFNIVAVSDFNMGAMENKGLNIFNDKYILADADTATDVDYEMIESIVAHEYFHNWTGNRITCREWFQLSLKEGLTVFRDQQFSEDMRSAAVRRIDDVDALRGRQFTEDASPLAHPVRPESYIEINNFYTATVYEKGAEVIRMQHTLLGADTYRKALDLYFTRHDGQAVTCEDFVACMEDAGERDLSQFKLWYRQAGTPVVTARGAHDAQANTYTLTLSQSLSATPGQPTKEPMHVPFAVGFVGRNGQDVPLKLQGEAAAPASTVVLELRQPSQQFVFENVPAGALPSLNRAFSAPVNVVSALSDADRAFLMAHDSDTFNRWQAKQDYAASVLLNDAPQEAFLSALGDVLDDAKIDDAYKAWLMTLPGYDDLANRMAVEDPINLYAKREALKRAIGAKHREKLTALYNAKRGGAFTPDADGAGRRALKNAALGYLAALAAPETTQMVKQQFDAADNMTDRMAALALLADLAGPERQQALDAFHTRFKDDAVVLDKWLSVQACSALPGTLVGVQSLLSHPSYEPKNPNRIRALIGGFSVRNPVHFHAVDGSGYAFLARQIIAVDKFNPQTAARLLPPLGRWKRFDAGRQSAMKQALEQIIAEPGLSRDVYELASKSLAG
ncbi:MAG: aminopeptidase N [Rhodospirillaceae bacterium]|nr:aminopeptidase N [Rhodospirillaceae bacterium]